MARSTYIYVVRQGEAVWPFTVKYEAQWFIQRNLENPDIIIERHLDGYRHKGMPVYLSRAEFMKGVS